jgi:hypothetical protein
VDHIQILKRAAQVVWKYRALWVIGLLLVLAGGGVLNGFNGAPGSPGSADSDSNGYRYHWDHQGWDNLDEFWADAGPVIVGMGAVLLTIIAVAVTIGVVRVVLRYVTRTSLIRMVAQYEVTGEKVSFGGGFKMGWSRASFRLFLISLIVKLPIALATLLVIIPTIALAVISFVDGAGPQIALGIGLILLLIPISLFAGLVGALVGPLIQIAYRIAALEDKGAWAAVKSAFGLIRRNLGATALQWLLLVGLGIAFRIALVPINLLLVLLGVLVGGVPGMLVGGLTSLIGGWPWGVGTGVLVFVPLFIALVVLPNILLSTAATVYHSTVWTLAYRELCAIDEGALIVAEPEAEAEAEAEGEAEPEDEGEAE